MCVCVCVRDACAHTVPDYWCAPVQSDELVASSSNAGQENECPSVTLKPLTVTLWRMPDIKQEVCD